MGHVKSELYFPFGRVFEVGLPPFAPGPQLWKGVGGSLQVWRVGIGDCVIEYANDDVDVINDDAGNDRTQPGVNVGTGTANIQLAVVVRM